MLTNALKLANGEPLYGAPERLDSYSYSPLLDVVHRALLRPFGVELELFAHRALILADQAVAFLVLAFALGLVGPKPSRPVLPLVRASSLALLLFASYAGADRRGGPPRSPDARVLRRGDRGRRRRGPHAPRARHGALASGHAARRRVQALRRRDRSRPLRDRSSVATSAPSGSS
ncbi:MAG: hypothetical protein U0235_05555 [Polyangiaceae bacterium]